MSPEATEALRKIRALQKHPLPQTPIAIERILKSLGIADYVAVVLAIEARP